MRQYELAIRIAQIHHLVDERKYKKALAVIQTLDMRQVRSLSDLKVFAEVYTKTEQYDAAKATYLRIYRRSHTKRVLYRLIYLSIRTNALEDAEAYYQEFVHMSPNARDALILRYRIDKASGAPIGRLIDILQELKQEEYIEEWAYELAKLYHRAGRREECYEECKDIILWFGTGEIVERAKVLMEHLEAHDPIPYYDDKDFTVPKKEEPNPDDTGSLPDLNEFIKERKAQKKEERRIEREARREEERLEEEQDEEEEEEFTDDYDERFEPDFDFSQKAKDGIQKLSGLFGLNKKEETQDESDEAKKEQPEKKQTQKDSAPAQPKEENKQPQPMRHSQSGTGITQDLAREISAIYEMEHKEQLKEKAVTIINEAPVMTSNVIERMTQAVQKKAEQTKSYIPLDIEEIQGAAGEQKTEEAAAAKEPEMPAEEKAAEPDIQPEAQAEENVAETDATTKAESTATEPEVSAEAESAEEEPEALAEEIEVQPQTDMQEEKPEAETQPQQTPEQDAQLLKELLQEEPVETEAPDLANYKAPDIPVVETEYMEMPEISYEDLPTTRALQRSFDDILTLIRGELDPSHFVLMGSGPERIVGVTKKIVRVMKESGYLSNGKIAKIQATRLNKMDLTAFRQQLKGNCLLVENAADLLFPTITKIFSIMEEYHGDIVIVLVDEGTTLDQLFRFVPILAKKFKYIIDISRYTQKDYE